MSITENINDMKNQREMRIWEWYISWYISLFFWFFSLWIVMCFLYPSFFVNPDLLPIYKNYISFIRGLLSLFLYTSILFWFLSFYLSKNKLLSLIWIWLSWIALFFWWSSVESVKNIDGGLYIWLDWFILDLILSALIFTIIEKYFWNIKNQNIFREWWFLDLKYFFVNHLLVWIFLITMNFVINNIFSYLIIESIQIYIQEINIVIQVIFIFLIADFVFYWAHRAYHTKRFLRKVHSIHHSAEKMDWLAGSRLHIIEIFLTRIFLILPVIFLWFSEIAINAYVVLVSIHSVFIHSNIFVGNSFIDKIIVTPKFHHWHHSDEKKGLNKNFAWQFAFYDTLFWTAVFDEKYPISYGVLNKKDYPDGIIKQTLYPFLKRKR